MEEIRENQKVVKTEYVTTTQKIIPIKDIYKGVVITTDGRYVKILEVLPQPFFMMTADERTRIVASFEQVIVNAPLNIQISEITLPSDITRQMDALKKHKAHETSGNCIKVIEDYEEKLIESKKYSVSRRFFLSFEYEGGNNLFKSPNISEIVQSLNKTAQILIGELEMCGNSVVEFNPENPNYAPAEILYRVINRSEDAPTFEERLTDVYKGYYDKFGDRDLYVPPNMLIAPKEIILGSKRYVVIDGMYYSYFYIPSRHYSEFVGAGWLNPFISFAKGVDVNIYFKKTPQEELGKVNYLLGRAIIMSGVDAANNSFGTDSREFAEESYDAAAYLKSNMKSHPFMHMAVLVTVYGKSPEEVESLVDNLKMITSALSIKLFPCTYLEANAFESSLPLGKLDDSIFNISKRNALSIDAASVYPFTAHEINDPEGIYFGTNINNRSMTIIDLFNKDRLTNSNMFISGTSGSGKTYSLSLLAIRSRANHIPVTIIAPEKQHEFRRVCNALGGEFIEIAPGSPNRINIMEILKPDLKAINENKEFYEQFFDSSFLADKVSNLKTFFSLFLEDMTIQEKQLLDRAIMQTYRKFGITLDNESLFDPNYDDGRYKKMPIISDLQVVIEEMAKENNALKRLADTIPYFTEGSGSSFNGQTNVDLNNEFIVIGLEKMKDDDLKLGMFMTMDYAWSKIKENASQKKLLIMDEWWRLSSDQSSADYSMRIARTIRSFRGSFILATQQLKDIFAVENGKYGEGVLANCHTKVLLGMTPDDADRVKGILNLTAKERDNLTTYKDGKCLLLLGNTKMELKFESSEFEHRLITTNPADIEKMIKERRAPIEEVKDTPLETIEVFAEKDVIEVLDEKEYINIYLNTDMKGEDNAKELE